MQTNNPQRAPRVFPFTDPRVAYFKVVEGEIVQVRIDRSTVSQLKSTDGRLYAAWPGEYKTNVFEVPLLELYKAFMLTDPFG